MTIKQNSAKLDYIVRPIYNSHISLRRHTHAYNWLLYTADYCIEVISFFPEFLKWTHPVLNLDLSTGANRGFNLQSKQNDSADSDETARDEPSHLNQHYLHRYWFLFAGIKGSNVYIKQHFGSQKKWPLRIESWLL